MKDGNLDGGFFAIYTEQGPLITEGYAAALAHARKRSDEIDRMVADNAGVIGAARTAEDARRLNKEGKLIALKSMEHSYKTGPDLSPPKDFHQPGGRPSGPGHGPTRPGRAGAGE